MTAQAKRALRAALRAERRALSDDARAAASQAIARRLVACGALGDGLVVGLFWPLADELDPNVALDDPGTRGVVPVWPRVEAAARAMAFCRAAVAPDAPAPGAPGARAAVAASLARGAYGIFEPTGASIDPRALDVVIVPGLAFDRSGHRLGFGAGYYDRFLTRAPQARCYGVALDAHLLDTLPHQDHDQPVDGVVTPSQLWRPRARLA